MAELKDLLSQIADATAKGILAELESGEPLSPSMAQAATKFLKDMGFHKIMEEDGVVTELGTELGMEQTGGIDNLDFDSYRSKFTSLNISDDKEPEDYAEEAV